MGGADPEVHVFNLSSRIWQPDRPAESLCRGALFYAGQLRADARRRARSQPAAQARCGCLGRGPAHQELGHQDCPSHQAVAQPLRLRSDGNAHREPHRRTPFVDRFPGPFDPRSLVSLQSRVLRTRRPGPALRVPQPGLLARTDSAALAPAPQERCRDPVCPFGRHAERRKRRVRGRCLAMGAGEVKVRRRSRAGVGRGNSRAANRAARPWRPPRFSPRPAGNRTDWLGWPGRFQSSS